MDWKPETILSGADANCNVCGQPYGFSVLQSAAGWYIGTACCSGGNTRESHYWETREAAESALGLWREGDYLGALER